MRKRLPYTRTSKRLNQKIALVMAAYKAFLKFAKGLGFDVCLNVGSETLVLYFHDDYPNLILVDKAASSIMKRRNDK